MTADERRSLRPPVPRPAACGGAPARPALAVGIRRATAGAAALGDPSRLEIAAALDQGGELCVCDLAWITERSQNLVSHHLRALRRADLVASRRDGKLVMYTLTDAGRRLLPAVLSPGAEVSA